MIPTSKVIELISAVKNGDLNKLDASIKEIISTAEKKGQIKLAQQLRKLYSAPNSSSNQRPTPNQSNHESMNFSPQNLSGTKDSLFEKRISKVNMDNIILSKKNHDIFKDIKDSFEKRKEFISKGIASENKILLYGSPGTGKTLFAYVIAGELNLPIIHVHLDTLVSSYLGETGKNIRQIFEEARKEDCILFIDEFDSIAKKRDDHHELGELKRVVTVLLQNIDELSPNNILVAATNHEHLLDEAIWRRFDYQLNLDLLDQNSLKNLFTLYLEKDKNIDVEMLSFISSGKSGAVIKQAIHKALRKRIINKDSTDINISLLEELLKISNLKDVDKSTDDSKKFLKEIISKLRTYNKKYYTYQKLEEITGIPDSSLSNYSK
jgi:SpoVK/Ycf46/Vps4 family AAA+-type ATPase